MEKEILNILHKSGLLIHNNIDELNNQMILRDILLSDERYENCKEDIKNLKSYLSSSTLTSLQSNAEKNQKFLLLNLVRQLLKIYDYKMEPIRVSNGYSKDGKKLFKRFFKIKKNNDNKNNSNNDISISN